MIDKADSEKIDLSAKDLIGRTGFELAKDEGRT